MKIDDVIKKCIEMPGVSLKHGEYSTELILNQKEGKGSMTFFPLFSGITLAYIFINSPTWPAPNLGGNSSNEKGPLIINYCVTGRCELILNNKNYVYVTDRQISLTEQFAQNQYIYPRRIYEGLELFIDLDSVEEHSSYLLQTFGLDLRKLTEMYCPYGKTYISDETLFMGQTLQNLWALANETDAYSVLQMKVLTLSFLGLLLNEKEIPPSRSCTFYTESQVEIAKKVEKIITSDLRQHHPAWELAANFSISETSLKNYFRGVFGQNISVYLREVRMNKAAELLVNTTFSVAEIAENVGYINQSKFASVFKKQFGVSPLEYRRTKRLDNLK